MQRASFVYIIFIYFTDIIEAKKSIKKSFNENCCHQQVRAETISTMRVIGKFIGFVASRSYSYDGYRNSLVDQKQMSIRNLVRKFILKIPLNI